MKIGMLVIIMCMLPGFAMAEPVVTERYTYYGIEGDTLEALIRQKEEYGVKWKDGKTYGAYTHPTIGWDFKFQPGVDGCRITQVTTKVEIEYIMPEWLNKDKAPQALRAKWERYYTALRDHEVWHKKLAVRTASLIEAKFQDLPRFPDCITLQAEAERIGKAILVAGKHAQAKFDEATDHGRTQGAVLQ